MDGGATFGPAINLSMNPEGSFNPAIAISGNNIHIVWTNVTR